MALSSRLGHARRRCRRRSAAGILHSPEATSSEKELLESWKVERPSAAAREKTIAVLGLGGASLGAAAAGSSIAPKATALSALTLTKWLALGAIGAGVTVAGALYLRHAEPAPPPARVVPPVKSPRAPPAETRSPEGGLTEQITKLDQARAALAKGDAAGTQRLVNDYEARFPEGSFLEEAEILRIEALLRQSDPAGAGQAGARFLNAHPTSPHAARVRALLAGPLP